MARSVEEWIGANDDAGGSRRAARTCSVPNCAKPHDSHGFCGSHAHRFRRHGDPLGGTTNRGAATQFMHDVVIPYSGEDCLQWPFGNNGKGYGVYHIKRRAVAAHRFVCEAAHGPQPSKNHEVAHSCGNGHLLCVNPKHLRWATRSENHLDKIKHGTAPRGTKNPMAKLSEADVRAIRSLIGSQPQWKIANQFGISQMIVSKISRNLVWGWLE
jgi:hypothetical protein